MSHTMTYLFRWCFTTVKRIQIVSVTRLR